MLKEKTIKNKLKSKLLLLFFLSVFIIIILFNSSLYRNNSHEINYDNYSNRTINNSAAPIQAEVVTTHYNGSGWAFDVFVSGEIAYIADYGDGLEIVNISDPSNPVTLGGCKPAGGEALGVFISGDLAYIAYGSGGLRIINISDPFYPFEIGSYGDGDNDTNAVYVCLLYTSPSPRDRS